MRVERRRASSILHVYRNAKPSGEDTQEAPSDLAAIPEDDFEDTDVAIEEQASRERIETKLVNVHFSTQEPSTPHAASVVANPPQSAAEIDEMRAAELVENILSSEVEQKPRFTPHSRESIV